MINKVTSIVIAFLLGSMTVCASSPLPYKADITGEMPETLQNILKQKNKKINYDAYLHQLLLLGDVIYGSELNTYVDNVADKLLADNWDLRQEIEIYIVRNNAVNAMMSEKGIMLINTGLLAQISNEAELAFIMLHELSHYTLKHGWDKKHKDSDVSLSNFLLRHNRSREQELEADAHAMNMLSLTSYDINCYDGVFDVLLYNNSPYDEIPFTREIVEESFYQFPENYFLNDVEAIVVRDNYIDTLSTHPNIARRREECSTIALSNKEEGYYFLQGEEAFKQMQYLARCICLNNDIMMHNYATALYNSHVMLQTYPTDSYLQLINAYCYYGIAKHKSGMGMSNVMTNYKKVMGEKQQLNYFIGKLSNREITTLALRKCFALYEQDPNNSFIENLNKNLIADLVQKYNLTFDKFTNYAQGTTPKLDEVIEEVDTTSNNGKSNKYKNINKGKKSAKSNKSNKNQVVNFMLVDYANNENMQSLFAKTLSKEDSKVLSIVEQQSNFDDAGVYILKPYVNLVHLKDKKRVAGNEKYALKSWETTQKSAKKLKLNMPNYDTQNDLTNTSNYVANAKINDWSCDLSYSISNDMIPFESFGIDKYIDTNNNYIILTCVATNREKMTFGTWFTRGSFVSTIATIAYPYVLPAMVAINALPLTHSVVLFYLIDPITGKTVYSKKASYNDLQSNAYIDAFIYDCLYQIKKGGKK